MCGLCEYNTSKAEHGQIERITTSRVFFSLTTHIIRFSHTEIISLKPKREYELYDDDNINDHLTVITFNIL